MPAPRILTNEEGANVIEIPAFICPDHGLLPDSPGQPAYIQGKGVEFDGFTVTRQCPVCKKNIEVKVGETIQFDRKGIVSIKELLSGPEFTSEVLLQLKHAVDRAKENPDSIAQFSAEANSIVPSLGDRFEQFCKDRAATIAFFSMLAAVIAALLTGIAMLKPAEQAPQPSITNNNYYAALPVVQNPLSTKQQASLKQIQNAKLVKRGAKLTAPKNKKARKRRP